MSSRPKIPKYARNKNVLVVGGSGSGKTRFFIKPNLLQMHSSYVVTDPKGGLVNEVGNAKYKLAAGKTAKSILVSCGARLAPFDIKELRDLTAYDELELDTLGDEKTALFLIMSDTDGTFNFLISMIYTQMFNLLCEKADDVYGGRLPVHVRCLIDEAANIGQNPNLEKLVATIRSREISACLVLQAKSQLKAIYKDNADTIIGNMDSQIFLGGTEQTTLKDLNAILGKETIDMYNTGQSKGSQESYNINYQKLGKDMPYLFVKSSAALNFT